MSQNVPTFNPQQILALLDRYSDLKRLDLDFTQPDSIQDFTRKFSAIPQAIVQHKALEEIHLTARVHSEKDEAFLHKLALAVAKRGTLQEVSPLRKLSLRLTNGSDTALKYFDRGNTTLPAVFAGAIGENTHLEYLAIRHADEKTLSAVTDITKHFPQLYDLDISGISIASLLGTDIFDNLAAHKHLAALHLASGGALHDNEKKVFGEKLLTMVKKNEGLYLISHIDKLENCPQDLLNRLIDRKSRLGNTYVGLLKTQGNNYNTDYAQKHQLSVKHYAEHMPARYTDEPVLNLDFSAASSITKHEDRHALLLKHIMYSDTLTAVNLNATYAQNLDVKLLSEVLAAIEWRGKNNTQPALNQLSIHTVNGMDKTIQALVDVVDDRTIKAIGENKHLSSLRYSGGTANMVEHILQKTHTFPKLAMLDISGNDLLKHIGSSGATHNIPKLLAKHTQLAKLLVREPNELAPQNPYLFKNAEVALHPVVIANQGLYEISHLPELAKDSPTVTLLEQRRTMVDKILGIPFYLGVVTNEDIAFCKQHPQALCQRAETYGISEEQAQAKLMVAIIGKQYTATHNDIKFMQQHWGIVQDVAKGAFEHLYIDHYIAQRAEQGGITVHGKPNPNGLRVPGEAALKYVQGQQKTHSNIVESMKIAKEFGYGFSKKELSLEHQHPMDNTPLHMEVFLKTCKLYPRMIPVMAELIYGKADKTTLAQFKIALEKYEMDDSTGKSGVNNEKIVRDLVEIRKKTWEHQEKTRARSNPSGGWASWFGL